MIKNYQNYIVEGNKFKFNVGDKAYFMSVFSLFSRFFGEVVIKDKRIFDKICWYTIENPKTKMIPIKWIREDELFNSKEEAEEYINKKKSEIDEIIKKIENDKKRKRELMKDIDPYSEEDWMSEGKVLYNKTLCDAIWSGDKIIKRIKDKLVKIAKDFYNDIELESEIIDIRLTGSMANYNYTDESDIDVHIVIDFKDVNEDIDLVKKAVDGQRFIWNLRHNIKIKGHDVELYIQDEKEEHTSAGLYSLLNDEWTVEPEYKVPDINTEDVDLKYEARLNDINRFEKLSKKDLDPDEADEYYKSAKNLKSKIMKARKEGLVEKEGEYSIENLVFKKLRSEGNIKTLIDTITRFYDKIYSQ